MQTETLKTEGQRRKVRKGTAAGVVGGIWLMYDSTVSSKERIWVEGAAGGCKER